jgi:hypothetical protein
MTRSHTASEAVHVSPKPIDHAWEEWFEPLRRLREERRLPKGPGSGRKHAVLTIVQNEPLFLPIWLRHYSRYFAPDDIYVLDHDSTDGSTSGGGFVRIPVTHDRVENEWMVSTVEANQRELLERYDTVLVTDIDEIVVPRPEWGTLDEYLDRFDEELVNCLGYEILHLRDIEAPLDPSRPILDQRGYWFANGAYDKAALATVPMKWKPGFHGREDNAYAADPDLYMVHLHRVDYGICQARHRMWRERAWNRKDLVAGWGSHNRIADDEEFERWFYGDTSFEGIQLQVEPIPPGWRGTF